MEAKHWLRLKEKLRRHFFEEDKGKTSAEAERGDITTKKPLLHVIYCKNM